MHIIDKSRVIAPENRSVELSGKVLKMVEAIESNKDFELIESRFYENERIRIEILIIDFKCESIKSKNTFGILNREPLAILHIDTLEDHPFRVTALRKNFPEDILHLNSAFGLLPNTLCLYQEPWEEIERYWTPQNFLNRIRWWMISTSNNTLHDNDQVLERPYFSSEYQLLLPQSSQNDINFDSFRFDEENNILRVNYKNEPKNCYLLVLSIDPIIHTRVFPIPENVGELEYQFGRRSSSVIDKLKEAISNKINEFGTPVRDFIQKTFVILKFRRFDNLGNLMNHSELMAFLIPLSLGNIGAALGVLETSPTDSSKYFKITSLGGVERVTNTSENQLRKIQIYPVEIVKPLNSDFANSMSGISKEEANFKGMLIGAGSLGSTLAEIWSKSGWGSWTLFDNDRLNAHNVFRHLGKEKDIGRNKARLVAELMDQNFSPGSSLVSSIAEKISIKNVNDRNIDYKEIDLVVDASASNYLLRDLSKSNDINRACSLFFNQSGSGGILFLEDKERTIRLESIELNYFRALINEDWGENFLQKNNKIVQVGASCSDLSVVLSYERVLLLSSSLSNMLRSCVKSNHATFCILKLDADSGRIDSYRVELTKPKSIVINDWNIFYDTFIENKLSHLRAESLPNETGGIVIGYIDQKTKSIYIVDITNAPEDSRSSISGFERGSEGLTEYLDKVKKRTSENCDYIGDWHSHPAGHSSEASQTDLTSLSEFAKVMNSEGLPILMIIVSDDIRFYIK